MQDDTIKDIDWLRVSQSWNYAYGGPLGDASIKRKFEDFRVVEVMDVVPAGEGEHHWLRIRKTGQNTDMVAKQLARFCNIAYKDVGYSGLKDNFAITEQWFSLWLPGSKGGTSDGGLRWSEFEMTGVEILEVTRHLRKLKRGTHRANHFEIVIRDLAESIDSLRLNEVLTKIAEFGVPNYFGPQRFGHNMNNMPRALAMLNNPSGGKRKAKDRQLRSLLLSAARAWLFNTQLDQRIMNRTWQNLYVAEPANLDGTASVFSADGAPQQAQRLQSMDIHPTAALWGDHSKQDVVAYAELHDLECRWIEQYKDLADGLIAARIAYSRRALRIHVRELEWSHAGDQLHLSFSLSKGQFATSVIRELVNTQ